MDVKSRLVNYYKNNQFIQKYITGLNPSTNEVVLVCDGKKKNVPIDTLEKITDETSLINYINVTNAEEAEVKEEIIEEPQEEVLEETQPSATVTPLVSAEPTIETLNDIKILTELKNKSALDNILRKFAVNETTGLIDINKAIEVVEENTRKEVIEVIKNNYAFDLNPINYDIQGKLIGEKIPDAISADEKIVSSFNNIRVYLEASKMYPEQVNYSEEMINKKLNEYIVKTKELINNKPQKAEVTPISPVKELVNTPVTDVKSAGFADILVLSIIVIVYAVIILNLILKIA